MLHHYGTKYDPAFYFEDDPTADGATDPPGRSSGTTVAVRAAADGATLASFVTTAGGYAEVSYDDVPAILVSTDNWKSVGGPFYSKESRQNAHDAGGNAANALSASTAAQATADHALQVAEAGGDLEINGKAPVDGKLTLTAADVEARPTDTPVPVADVDGLADVATSGKYSDLSGRPAAAIPASDKGQPGGVPTLDSTGVIPESQLPTALGTVTEVNDVQPGSDGKLTLTASDVGARSSDDDVPVADVSGLADVATSGSYDDLDNAPAIPSTPGAVGAQPALGFSIYVQQSQPSSPAVNDLWFSDSSGGDTDGPTLTQVGAATTDTFGSTLTVSPAQKLTSGSVVVLAAACISDGNTLTVADDGGSTWAADVSTAYATSPKVHVYLFSATLTADIDTTDTITITSSSSGEMLSAAVMLATGVTGGASKTATGTGNDHTYLVSSAQTPTSGDLVVCAIASNYPSLQSDFVSGAGYTALSGIGPNASSNNRTIVVQYLVSTGTATAGNASAANNHSWAEVLAVYGAA